ncbi:MAG: hypothetical protein KF846_08415 [Cyclobacteriaceae bacterium]|nr:hypothetical protein [Cyclobacteriaceae bacterium]
MNQQICKTSSLLIDLKNSSFKKLKVENSVRQFDLPAYIQDKYNEYAILHNWAKDNLNLPYYLNIPLKKLYVLVPSKETIPELQFDDKKLSSSEFNDYDEQEKLHIIVKLLLAKYFELTESFVSNDKFFLYASMNRNKTWATVLKIDIAHNYRNKESIEFWVKDEATRLRGISEEEQGKYYQKEIIYGQSIRNGQTFFKQLKRKEIKGFGGLLFAKPKTGFVGNTKAKINYHSIFDSTGHEASKAFLLERFITKFLQFLNDYGIKATSKELHLSKVNIERQRAGLDIKNFNVSLVDGRKVKNRDLSEIFESNKEVLFTKKEIEDLQENESCLFVMDYNKEDFEERFKEEEDPYKTFKENAQYKGIAKQGICINENYFEEDASDSETSREDYLTYEGLSEEDLQRNLNICITQLFLKRILLNKNASLLPHNEILKTHCFSYRNYLLSVEGDNLEFEKFETAGALLQKVTQKFGNINAEEIFETIYRYHNPFGSKKEFDFDNRKIIFSNESVIEILDIPERAFYNEQEIKQRIADRSRLRARSEFKSSYVDEVSKKFNIFLDEEIEGVMLSYEELKIKYGKGEKGFLKQIFGSKDERPFIKFLNDKTNVRVKGLKQDGVFSTYTGVWFDEGQQQYFVGRTHGYQHKQDKGAQMKKVLTHFGTFKSDTFFELLNVDFIRYKELTVNPYPFKLIEMYEIMATEQIAEL